MLPTISEDAAIQAAYEAMRAEGTGHMLAEMFALQSPPSSNTDREFMAGRCNGNQFEGREKEGDAYKRIAEAAGQNVKGKVYLGGLARFPGDPEAWVSGKGDAERVLDARGWGSEGLVKREVKNVAQPARVDVAPQLIEDEVQEIAEAVAGQEAHLVDKIDLAEQVHTRRKGAYSKEKFEPAVHTPNLLKDEACQP